MIRNNIFIVIFFFVFHYFCFSQQKISGYVKNDISYAIPGVSVRLLDNSHKIVSFTTTDASGYFELSYEVDGEYVLEIKHISYEAYRENLVLNENKTRYFEIKLIKPSQIIEEVVITSPNAAIRRGDTIKYNLKTLTTGNEQKLEDVIKKLPGLSINENGKITSKGKIVDVLMVNGKNFFGSNHKMATENISANMLDGIDLLNNYEGFQLVKDTEGSEKTALNIKVKKEHFGKITGNVNAILAYDKKYSTHANLFRFSQKTNISTILDFNNLGKQALSASDYSNMNKDIVQDIRNSDVPLSNYIQKEWIPDFLAKNNDVESKKYKFIAVDIFHQANDKVSINGFSIFNIINTYDNIYSKKTIFNVSNRIDSYENQINSSDFIYNQTKLNIEYKPNNNNLLNYSFYYDPQDLKSEKYTNNKVLDNYKSNIYREYYKDFSYSFGHQLSYITRISKNKLIYFNIFQDIKNQNNNYSLLGNNNVFTLDNLEFIQKNKLRKNELGTFVKYVQKEGKNVFKFNVGVSYDKQYFLSESILNSVEDNIKINFNNLFVSGSIIKRTGFFRYIAKLEMKNSIIEKFSEKKNILQFIPLIEIKFNFTDLHNITLSYNKTLDFSPINSINGFCYVKDFRTLYSVSKIDFYNLFKKDNYSFTYLNMDLYTGTLFFVSSNITKANKAISSNIINKGDFNEIINLISPKYMDITSYFVFEQKIKPIKNKFKLDFIHSYNQSGNYISNELNEINSNIYSLKISTVSNFRSSIFNYDTGIRYDLENFKYERFSNINKIKKIVPFINFNGKIKEKNIRYFIYNSYEFIKTRSSNTDFYNLGIKFMYDKKTEKYKYWVEGKDILNLNTSRIENISSEDNIFSVNTFSRLTGYIGIGISREF